MSNQLLGGGEPVNRVCAVRRQERVGGVGFVTPQVIRPLFIAALDGAQGRHPTQNLPYLYK